MSNENKHAWYDETYKGSVMVRVCMLDPIFHATIEQARELRDQLTQAIQEAEQDDPFEVWWNGLRSNSSDGGYRSVGDQLCMSKPVARAVWDAARKEKAGECIYSKAD